MNRVREWSLSKLDSLLNVCLPYQRRLYETQEKIKTYKSPLNLQLFAKKHGYFSHAPLLSTVSGDIKDVILVQQILESSMEVQNDWLDFCISELLTKALAYRDIAVQQEIRIPVRDLQNQVCLETFTLDRIFNLWHQMPAFGWVPQNSHIPSLLIFRGTDCSLITKRSLASLISDLDFSGPGFKVFKRSRAQIQAWLKDVKQKSRAARVMGCSLGGALATYVFTEYNDLLSQEVSIVFHPPGVCQQVKKAWDLLEEGIQKRLVTYIAQGDFVSKVRSLVGTTYILSVSTKLKPLAAHTLLFSGEPLLICQRERVHA